MRSVKIICMVNAVGTLRNFSKPTKKNSTETNLESQVRSFRNSNLPSAEEIATVALNTKNQLERVFTKIANQYNISGLNNTPASLRDVFNMLRNVSNVISKLPDSERLAVKKDLKIAFYNFYSENLNLPVSVSARAAKKLTNALTQGSSALLRLENSIKNDPRATRFAEHCISFLNSRMNNSFVAKNSNDSISNISNSPRNSRRYLTEGIFDLHKPSDRTMQSKTTQNS